MNSPFTGGMTTLSKEKRTLEFRKDSFEVLFHFYKCDDSGEQFTTESLDVLNTNQIYNQYRAKYGIPFTEEIIDIRDQYDLSAAKMSEILGFGINAYRQYEAGEIPSVSNGRLIQMAKDPKEFRRLVKYSQNEFTSQELKRIIEKIENFERGLNPQETYEEQIMLGPKTPNILNGFKSPDSTKIEQMILFFSEQLQPFKTKLNKLLFYADFLQFKKTGFSISGMQYKALPRGPVPKNYDWIFNRVIEKQLIKIEVQEFPDFIGEKYCPADKLNKEVFSDEELNTLSQVAEQFKDMSVNQIINYSHKEKGWVENIEQFGVISYEYGWDMV